MPRSHVLTNLQYKVYPSYMCFSFHLLLLYVCMCHVVCIGTALVTLESNIYLKASSQTVKTLENLSEFAMLKLMKLIFIHSHSAV